MSDQEQSRTLLQAMLGLIPEFVVVLVLATGIFYWVQSHNIYKSLKVNDELIGQYQATAQLEEKNSPTHIIIPELVDVAIREDYYDNGSWSVSDETASYLAQSAQPGEEGNIIVYGHNKKEILGNILSVSQGETIIIKTKDGVEHHYQVTKAREVSPGNVSLLQPTEEETLTIYTCSGFMDSKRYIIQAKPISLP